MRGTIRRSSLFILLVLLLQAVAVPGAVATTTLDAAFGTPFGAQTPRAAAMGSVGAALYQGSANLVANPAMLSRMDGRLRVEFNGGISQVNEDRYQPLFDSFESYLTDTVVASNRNSYGLLQGGAIYQLLPEHQVTVGIGIFDRYSFDYDYFEEIRDTNTSNVPSRDAVVQLRDYQIDGRLRSITFGYGMEITPRLRMGISLHRYTGTLTHTANTRTTALYLNTFTSDPGSAAFEHELRGWGWTAGLAGTVNERLDVGASFEGPFTVQGAISSMDSTIGSWMPYDQSVVVMPVTSGDVKVKYPGTLRAGVSYRPRNLLTTVFSVDLVRRFWEGVADESYRTAAFVSRGTLRDTWDLRFGLEHVFYNNVPARFGFRYLENYADPESNRSIFSGGVGYESAGYKFDVTLQYHRQTSRQAFIFDRTLTWSDGQVDPGPTSLSKVEDGMVSLLLGVSRNF